MVTARAGELSESWVTGRLLTHHLAVGGGGHSPLPSPGWASSRLHRCGFIGGVHRSPISSVGMTREVGGGTLNQAYSCGIRARWGQNGATGSVMDRLPLGGAVPSLEGCVCQGVEGALLCGLEQVHGPLWASVSSSITWDGEPSFVGSGQAHMPSGSESMCSSGDG